MTNIHAQALGKLGGKASVKSRFKGMTKKQKSEHMSRVRKGMKWEKQDSKNLVKHLKKVGQI